MKYKLTARELSSFCGQMGMLLHSGISTAEGLHILCDESKTDTDREILTPLIRSVEETGSLSQALEESAPISVVGTGPDLNAATDNGLARAAKLLGMTVPEVKNRATITGAIEIGRNPGVVQVTFRAPVARLEELGLLPFVRDQYGVG